MAYLNAWWLAWTENGRKYWMFLLLIQEIFMFDIECLLLKLKKVIPWWSMSAINSMIGLPLCMHMAYIKMALVIKMELQVWQNGKITHASMTCIAYFMYHSGIPPGASRTYEYNLGDQTGTYWIHGHVDVSIQAQCLYLISAILMNCFSCNIWMVFARHLSSMIPMILTRINMMKS